MISTQIPLINSSDLEASKADHQMTKLTTRTTHFHGGRGMIYQVLRNFASPDFHSRLKEPDGMLRVLNDHHISLAGAQSACRGRARTKLTWIQVGQIWEGRP